MFQHSKRKYPFVYLSKTSKKHGIEEKQQAVLTSVQLWSRFLAAWQAKGCVGQPAPGLGKKSGGKKGSWSDGKKCRTQVAVGISRASSDLFPARPRGPAHCWTTPATHPPTLASDSAHEHSLEKVSNQGGPVLSIKLATTVPSTEFKLKKRFEIFQNIWNQICVITNICSNFFKLLESRFKEQFRSKETWVGKIIDLVLLIFTASRLVE